MPKKILYNTNKNLSDYKQCLKYIFPTIKKGQQYLQYLENNYLIKENWCANNLSNKNKLIPKLNTCKLYNLIETTCETYKHTFYYT